MTSQESRIIAATQRLLEQGATVTMAALAEECGLSRATLYRVVPDRPALISLLARRGVVLPEDDTDARILRATRQVLEREGFGGATMEAIATAAGVSPVTLYRRYGDRERLLRAFLEAVPARKQVWVMKPTARTDVAAELSGLAAKALQDLLAARALLRAAFGAPAAERAQLSALHDGTRGMTAGLAKYFAACDQLELLEAPEPRRLAEVFTATLMGLALRTEVEGGAPPDPDELGAFVARTMLAGLLPREQR